MVSSCNRFSLLPFYEYHLIEAFRPSTNILFSQTCLVIQVIKLMIPVRHILYFTVVGVAVESLFSEPAVQVPVPKPTLGGFTHYLTPRILVFYEEASSVFKFGSLYQLAPSDIWL